MARFVYIDETGSVGKGAARQNQLTVVAAVVDERAVRPLGEALRALTRRHLGWIPPEMEFHGVEIWQGMGVWSELAPEQRLAAYEEAISLIETLGISISHATINKAQLHLRYGGAADANAYLLALQFLLEKIDSLGSDLKVLVADESKEQQLRAIKMVGDMQLWGGRGEVPGRQLATIIDSLHFVRSDASAGVQMADLVAYLIQRRRRAPEPHPDAHASRERMAGVISEHISTWREPWPN